MKAYNIERKANDRIEFTLWTTVFWLPVFPWRSWSAIYAGPLRPDGLKEDGHRFDDPVAIDRDPSSYIRTVTTSLLVLVLAIAPSGYLIIRTSGRAATPLEMVFVFASCIWPVVVIITAEQHRTKLLKGRDQ